MTVAGSFQFSHYVFVGVMLGALRYLLTAPPPLPASGQGRLSTPRVRMRVEQRELTNVLDESGCSVARAIEKLVRKRRSEWGKLHES